ncbi:MAG: UDP-N-acetylmuramoyl-tripeptide--D-alanyl-D-alanine ligase [Candidatus Neomarinimicrobiota bacterium]|jgi:UDP-N-acetylmuramoyl-tripeptide--D-alanyl-D-alanine ligase|nr:MAG: UDP-N-acetylmuramoyl-tripeptide--D-alanyl-D-alanine ligase [Candidatus Neomarinimicrobiota bacterium]|tara:strand:+ start:4242 stop:5480 length:1239 start_codon:yes stop_codon:yes gene_type:complete
MRIDIIETDLFLSYLSEALNRDNLSPISGITTDSRHVKENDLFLAIKGEHFDGSDFIDEALSNGAIYAIAQSVHENDNVFTVDDVIEFIGKICSEWMVNFNGKTIAITGSNGKTTTKDLISHILIKSGHNVSKTEGNFNTSIGVPLTIFSFSNDPSQIYVLELGANQVGDIDYLSSLVKPDIGIVTNISGAHLEGFGSIENIRKEKKSIFNHSNKGYYGDEIETSVTLSNHPLANNKVFLKNASIAYEVCKDFMVKSDQEEFSRIIEDFVLPKGRGQIYSLSKGIVLIDDTYNANPESVKAAIDNLARHKTKGRRIFIFGDMKELGENEIDFHKEIANYCEGKIDGIICYGDLAKNTFNNSKSISLRLHFDNKDALVAEVCSLLENDDIIMLKGSRSMELDSVAEDIKNHVK